MRWLCLHKFTLVYPDFLSRLDTPPKIIWLTCGNTSNTRLKEILSATLLDALKFLETSEKLVEISGD